MPTYLRPHAGAAREGRSVAGAPVAGTNEVQTLTSTATGGQFKLLFRGVRSGLIDWNDSAADIQTILRAMANIGSTGVTCGGGPLNTTPVTITFGGAPLERQAQPLVQVVESTLTGGTVTPSETTPGVAATHRGAPKGTPLMDTTNGIAYVNTGTTTAPTWTKVGTQT